MDDKTTEKTGQKSHEVNEDNQELTFEHGYGAQEGALSEGESLEDAAGVSEQDVHDDLLGEQHADEAGEQSGDDSR